MSNCFRFLTLCFFCLSLLAVVGTSSPAGESIGSDPISRWEQGPQSEFDLYFWTMILIEKLFYSDPEADEPQALRCEESALADAPEQNTAWDFACSLTWEEAKAIQESLINETPAPQKFVEWAQDIGFGEALQWVQKRLTPQSP